ncbi:hypothetical protein AB0M20_45465 [Actinoplanes sp. NPDC051633]|uniref:hypothetical protein n=1 Tax=Actinoplanes sp. NPDC051633 TaxID=3155670 RepID=UPI00341B60E0
MTAADIVALAEGCGFTITANSSLSESQVYVLMGPAGCRRQVPMAHVMGDEWPPPQPRPRSIAMPAPIAFPRPSPARPQGRQRDADLFGWPETPASEASRRAAAAARPGPPTQRPLLIPANQRGRQRPAARDNRARRSVRVSGMGSLARVLMPVELRNQERIREHEAERYNNQAKQWAVHGFTDRTVLPWLDLGLSPVEAGYLAVEGVKPELLNRLVPVPTDVMAAVVALPKTLLQSGRIPVGVVCKLLEEAGLYLPPPVPDLSPVTPAAPKADRPPVPVVSFSSPGDVDNPADPVRPSRSRRGRGARRGKGGSSGRAA